MIWVRSSGPGLTQLVVPALLINISRVILVCLSLGLNRRGLCLDVFELLILGKATVIRFITTLGKKADAKGLIGVKKKVVGGSHKRISSEVKNAKDSSDLEI